jgi:hypothetical protein
MITRVCHSEERYQTPQSCLAGIRTYLERGWEIRQLRGPQTGPFVVVFRMEDAEQAADAREVGLGAGLR